jgi:hypothetical protein
MNTQTTGARRVAGLGIPWKIMTAVFTRGIRWIDLDTAITCKGNPKKFEVKLLPIQSGQVGSIPYTDEFRTR